MKKTIYLVSVIFLLISCASAPENKVPVDDSLVKLHRAKEIQCSFTKGIEIELTEQGEFDFEDWGLGADDRLHFLIKIDPKSGNATINYSKDINDLEGEEIQDTFTSKVQRWEEGILFNFYDEEEEAILTIVVFNADDDLSDYEATISAPFIDYRPIMYNLWGSCKIQPQDMKKSTKLKDVSFTIKSVNTYSPLKEPWGEYKVIVETSTLPHERLLREIALEIWRTEGTGFHEFNIEYYLPEMDTLGIPYAEAIVGPYGVSTFNFSQ